MSNQDAIPSRGDAVVALTYLRDTRNSAPPPDHCGGRPLTDALDTREARR